MTIKPGNAQARDTYKDKSITQAQVRRNPNPMQERSKVSNQQGEDQVKWNGEGLSFYKKG